MRVPGPALVLPMLLLTGCALPPAVTVASLVLDGVSYVSTGKSTTDHAISALADEDCTLLRVVDGKEVCDPNGEVLFALAADDPANENWYLDPETGSPDPNVTTGWGTVSDLEAAVENEPEAQPEVSATSAKNLGTVASATPALTPGPVGQGKSLTPLVTAITIAAKPSPRGLFANAHPAPKPEEPQLPIQAVSRFARLTLQDGEVVTYTVIASFQNVENARRMVGARDDDACEPACKSDPDIGVIGVQK